MAELHARNKWAIMSYFYKNRMSANKAGCVKTRISNNWAFILGPIPAVCASGCCGAWSLVAAWWLCWRHRSGQTCLCEQRHQGQAVGVGKAGAASVEQHQGAIRQLTRLENRTDERHHGRAGRAHADEHTGAEFCCDTGRHQRHLAQQRWALRVAARAGWGLTGIQALSN